MNKEEALSFLKNKNNLMIIGVIILGIIFMTAFSDSGGDKKEADIKAVNVDVQEERLREILSDIDGAGDVSVMITYEGTSEKNIAYEKRRSDSAYDEKAVMAGGEPMVVNESYPTVKGVIVTAGGADDIKVKRALVEAVSAVLEVEPHRICIYKKR